MQISVNMNLTLLAPAFGLPSSTDRPNWTCMAALADILGQSAHSYERWEGRDEWKVQLGIEKGMLYDITWLYERYCK